MDSRIRREHPSHGKKVLGGNDRPKKSPRTRDGFPIWGQLVIAHPVVHVLDVVDPRVNIP